jgi:hypothetical protein
MAPGVPGRIRPPQGGYRSPLLNMQSLNDHMAGCTIFSKINLVKAYNQIPIAEEDIPKQQEPHLLEFLFMAFGGFPGPSAPQDNILITVFPF